MQALTIISLLLMASTVAADPVTQSVYTVPTGKCALTLEASPQWQSLRLRIQHPQYKNCLLTSQDLQTMLPAALAKLSEPAVAARYTSLSLGRLVDYPWLSAYLAETALTDRYWDRNKGRPKRGDLNAYAAKLLSSTAAIAPFSVPLVAAGYRISGVSVEKVLVGGIDNVPFYQGKKRRGRVPFDAQVWLRLRHD